VVGGVGFGGRDGREWGVDGGALKELRLLEGVVEDWRVVMRGDGIQITSAGSDNIRSPMRLLA
jgi:hypothetical protein